MRLASYVPGELIPCAFVWLDPGITPCCKTIFGSEARNTRSKFAAESLIQETGDSDSIIAHFRPPTGRLLHHNPSGNSGRMAAIRNNRRFGPGEPTWRWFRLGWALGQPRRKSWLRALTPQPARKCAGGLGGGDSFMRTASFLRSVRIAAASPYVQRGCRLPNRGGK